MYFIKIILILSLFFPLVYADEGAIKGEKLHQDNCIACHAAMTGGDGSVLYTRKDRRVTTHELLSKQINRCQTSLGLNWTSDEIGHVQHYLNVNFYKF